MGIGDGLPTSRLPYFVVRLAVDNLLYTGHNMNLTTTSSGLYGFSQSLEACWPLVGCERVIAKTTFKVA